MAAPLTRGEDGHWRLRVRVTPRAAREAIGDVATLADGRGVVAVRVTAPPADGAANQAVCRPVARAVGLAPGLVTVEAGASDLIKRLRLGADPSHWPDGWQPDPAGS